MTAAARAAPRCRASCSRSSWFSVRSRVISSRGVELLPERVGGGSLCGRDEAGTRGWGVAEPVDLLAESGLPVEPGTGHSGRLGHPVESDRVAAFGHPLQDTLRAPQGQFVSRLRRLAEPFDAVSHPRPARCAATAGT